MRKPWKRLVQASEEPGSAPCGLASCRQTLWHALGAYRRGRIHETQLAASWRAALGRVCLTPTGSKNLEPLLRLLDELGAQEVPRKLRMQVWLHMQVWLSLAEQAGWLQRRR